MIDLLLAQPFGDAGGIGLRAFGQVFQRGDDALQFAEVLGIGRQRRLQRVQPVAEHRPVGPRVDRQKRLAVAQEECPVPVFQFQLARFEDLAVLIAEDRQRRRFRNSSLTGRQSMSK